MDRTLKLRSYPDSVKHDAAKDNTAKERDIALELEKKTAHLEEERNKSLDLVKTIVQLRESLKQEQEKTAALEARVIKLDSVEENQLVKKNAELEEEKKKSLEYIKTIEQLRESRRQEVEKSAQMLNRMAELEAKVNKMDSVEGNQLVKKNTQLEEEKKKSAEYAKLVDQLREKLRQDQGISDDLVDYVVELEKKVKGLSEVANRISSLVVEKKLDSKT